MEPVYRDLAMMFMAAAPEGQPELDFEAEEAAILTATHRLPLQVFVEESGCLEFLKTRLVQEGPFEAVHFSCHGGISDAMGPVLALETPEGKTEYVPAGKAARALGEKKSAPGLCFGLSHGRDNRILCPRPDPVRGSKRSRLGRIGL